MFDLQAQAEPRKMQRARGVARIGFDDGRLTTLSQSGSAKVMLPSVHRAMPEAVFLNTAGGLTGGDRFEFSAHVTGGALLATTQTAERAYASTGAEADVTVSLTVGADATLLWLPQETILFENSALRRRTRIDAAPGARVLALETLVFGRAAMGETLSAFSLNDRRELYAPGPVWVDAVSLDAAALGQAAGLRDARAIATLLYWAPDAADVLNGLPLPDGCAASAWDGKLVIRAAASDLWPLKRALTPLIERLSGGVLPRVWAA
ncbi:MAG: urease accessory protein UreD [Pseudomonadota bacterium]